MTRRERTSLELLLRSDRSIVNGSEPEKWNWPSPPTEEQLREARTFVFLEGHCSMEFIAVLDGNAQSHGQAGGCQLDRENVVHGDEALIRPIEEEIAMLDEIRAIVIESPTRLEMDSWHGDEWTPEEDASCVRTCNTTHCLAGFAQALSPDPTMRRLPAETAGEILRPRAARMFFESEDRVLKYLRDREYATK